jgi:sortase (surface protein transpeptidase)
MLVLDQLEQWRIEQLLENYRADVEEQRREQEKQAKEQEKQMSSSGAAAKQPKLPNMSIPKLSVPKI